MKKLIGLRGLVVLLVLVGLLPSLHAQLAMELKSNQLAYMRYEAIYVQLRIRNDSGRPLVFGNDEKLRAKLFFEVLDNSMQPMEQFPEKMLELNQGKVIKPGETGELVFSFNRVFQFNQPGIYRVYAYIEHPMLEDKFKSNVLRIDIGEGSVVWSQEVGVPESVLDTSKDKKIKSRRFSIRTLVDGNQKYYYCIQEDQKTVYQIVRLGRVMGIDLPQREIDMASSLHLLLNIAPKIFKYYQIDILGDMVNKPRYYKVGQTVPRLIKDKNGRVFVAGGDDAVAGLDFEMEENPLLKQSAQ